MEQIFTAIQKWIAANYPGDRPTKFKVRLMSGEWVTLPLPCCSTQPSQPIGTNGGRTLVERDASDFVPHPVQKAILDALDGQAMRTEDLAGIVGGRSRLFDKKNGLQQLKDLGLIRNHMRLGFYRPDSPPDELATGRKRRRYVYFFQLGGTDGKIKIGIARDPGKRMASFKTHFDKPLKILGVIEGNCKTERALHQRFADDRLHGEWFKPTQSLLDYIKVNSSPWPPPRRR